ncbi:response regulator transcription factor [Actinoplanes sp. NPDC023714]|uniref:response regulator transcription factor n=1 Tax=Actinoplanes sp. NPDC023714 TaxID=3154322 RepID=UPI003403D568
MTTEEPRRDARTSGEQGAGATTSGKQDARATTSGKQDAGAMADGQPGTEPGTSGEPARRPPLRVLLADPAPLQRAGLRALLQTPPHPSAGRATPRLSAGQTAGFPSAGPAPSPSLARRFGNEVKFPARTEEPSAEPGGTGAGQSAAGVGPDAAGAGAGAAEIVVVGEAADGVEALDLARRLLPDVVVLELGLPRLDGLEVAQAIGAARLPVRVLVVTDEDAEERIVAAVGAGVTGYLCKDAPHDELVAAVRIVAGGGAVIAPKLLARILGRLAEALPAPGSNGADRLDVLTGREREVLVHVARGMTNTEIAEVLQVSETTVKTHVGHVLTKLRLRDRTRAVVLAYESGLVKPGSQDGR